MSKLIVTLDGVNLKEYMLDKARTSIGRKSSNDIHLNDQTVSSEHAALLRQEGIFVTDLGSTNGTFVNGEKVNKARLYHGDVIRIGKHELRFIDQRVQDHAATMILDSPGSLCAALRVLNGSKAGQVVGVTESQTPLGKPGEEVVIIVRNGSRFTLLPKPDAPEVPVRVNGQPLGGRGQELNHGDTLEVGETKLEFCLEGA